MEFVTLPVVPLAIDAIAKASVMLAATALAAAALRRASASARHFVWTLGLASALVVPALSFAVPKWELPIVRVAAPQTPARGESLPPSSGKSLEMTRRMESRMASATRDLPADGDGRASVASGGSRKDSSWASIALGVWAAGAAFVLGRMLLGLIAVQWMSRRTPIVTDGPWLRQAEGLAKELGLDRVRFHRSASASMPMAWGIFRRAVLMPADADAWPANRLRVVLLHELAHVKRRDCLTHLVAQIACAMHWFNPLAWMAARRLRAERERACDDLVLAAGTRGSDYADQLLDIARVMNAGRFPAVLAGASLAMAHRSQLEGRLIAILDPSVPRRGLTRARSIAAGAVFALLIVPVASVQPWAKERGDDAGAKNNDAAATQQPQAQQGDQKPYESYPGQAEKDARRNAMKQDQIQGQIQGAIQGSIQGAIQGPIQGAIQAQAQGAARGVLPQAVIDGIATSVANGIAGGVAGGLKEMAQGVALAVGQDVKPEDWKKEAESWKLEADRWKQQADSEKQGKQRDPRAVAALLEALKDSDKEVRETAMHALAGMRDPRVFEPLVQALKDQSADIREQAAFGLGQLHDARAVEPLTAALKDASASVREQVVFALGQLRAAGSVDGLAVALKDSNADVREQAAFALGQIRDKKVVEPLISALKDQDPDVREQAAFALGQIRDARAVEALVIALKDTNASVREQVVFALGQIGDARAIEGLALALKDPSASVRQQAAFALGQIR